MDIDLARKPAKWSRAHFREFLKQNCGHIVPSVMQFLTRGEIPCIIVVPLGLGRGLQLIEGFDHFALLVLGK